MTHWPWLGVGLGAGVLLATPLVILAVKRATQRVRRLERRAQAADRLGELGMLTGGLAHEIKNPLSTVGLNIQLLQEDLQTLTTQIPQQPEAQDQIGRIRRRFEALAGETQRVRDILEDFLRFAGRVKLHRVQTDIHTLIDELVDFYSPQAQASHIHLRTQLTANPSVAYVDISLVKQALLNILINATQAMAQARASGQPSGGCDELILRTERVGSQGHDEIHIHVTDTGPGIAPENLEKVFHPYYSTQKSGTGLGLPTARRIVLEHSGNLTIHSEIGRGTDFTITLPIDLPPQTATTQV